MIIREFGGPEKFEMAEMPKPVPGPNQVLVKVIAASVNPVDYKIRTYPSNWAGVPVPAILGYDGDEVFYCAKIFGRQGTYAPYHVEDGDIVVKKPTNLSFDQAACLPLAGMTAYDTIVSFFQTKPGDTVLIHAGAGGVGSLAVQLAKAAGARVIATGRKENEMLIRSLGADEVVDYKNLRFEDEVNRLTQGKGVDAAYDTVGGDTVVRSINCVRPYGKIASVVSVEGSIAGMQSRNLTLYFGFMERTSAKIQALAVLAERGQVRPLIDSIFPLEKVADSHRKIEAGGMKGKIVIHIGDQE